MGRAGGGETCCSRVRFLEVMASDADADPDASASIGSEISTCIAGAPEFTRRRRARAREERGRTRRLPPSRSTFQSGQV